MSDAKALLEMIENVSPTDTATLDKIDICVARYLGNHPYELYGKPLMLYTRRRDYLKKIRPDGWALDEIHYWHSTNQYGCLLRKFPYGTQTAYLEALPTEELAELHAVIQAVEQERTTPTTAKTGE